MTDYALIIAGGGPTGLMLAAELALQKVPVVVVERKTSRERAGAGALGLHARTLEVFEQRGIAGRFLAEGKPMQVLGFANVRLDISAFPSRHPYGLALAQKHTERLLLEWTEALGVPVIRGVEVTGFTEDAAGVSVTLSDGRSLRGQYLAGCDGGRSFVRKATGIAFPGWDATVSHLLAEAEFAETPPFGLYDDANGRHAFSPAEDGRITVLVTEGEIGTTEPALGDLGAALVAHRGTDYGLRGARWITRFTDMTRQAERYRKGRVLLAGDAAHIHYPAGGFGLNLGVQDAVNLGWKLAQVVNGESPETLLDTYDAERHPVAESLIRYTLAAVALNRADARTKALSGIVAELVAEDGAQKAIAGEMSGLEIRYDLGEGHPLLGRRMPDLDLATASGTVRVTALMHEARPLLVTFGAPLGLDVQPWADRVRLIEASYDGAWELPVIGAVTAPSAVLVRPDGHVAWVGEGSDAGLSEALTRWFGAPAGV